MAIEAKIKNHGDLEHFQKYEFAKGLFQSLERPYMKNIAASNMVRLLIGYTLKVGFYNE